MPLFSDFRHNLGEDHSAKLRYVLHRSRCRRISLSIPLIHVTCKCDLLLVDLANESQGFLSVTGTTPYSNWSTLDAENDAHLPPCLYFSVGRANDFGGVVLVISPDCEKEKNGSSTPFDSGGMIYGYIHPLSKQGKKERATFIEESKFPLSSWRQRFGAYLASFFQIPEDYMTGRPNRSDPEGILSDPDNEPRAWTFEVRICESLDMRNGNTLRWYAQHRHYRSLDFIQTDASLSQTDIIQELMRCGHVATDYIYEVEQWVRLTHFV